MPSTPADPRSRFPLAALVLATVLALASLVLLQPHSIPGSQLARASYDLSFRLRTPPDLSLDGGSPVVMVLLDRRSFDVLNHNPSQPLDRTLHARLVRRLHDAGASLVLFDFLFDQPSPNPDSDAAFALALRTHGNVLLGAEWHRSDVGRPDASNLSIRGVSLPTPELLTAAAGHGFVFSRVDPDFAVRRHFPGFLDRDLPSLTWEAARRLGTPVTQSAPGPQQPRWLNYYGPSLTLPHVSYADALDPTVTRDDMFRGKVVLIGTRPSAGRFDERRDEWRNPIARWQRGVPFMPAVEVHATELLNLIRGDWWRRLPPTTEAVLIGLVAVLLSGIFTRLRPTQVAVAALVAEGFVLLTAATLLAQQKIWFPWLIPAAIQIPAAASGSFLLHTVAWYRQRRRFLSRIRQQAVLLDKAQDAILTLNPEGTVTYANPRALALYGWTSTPVDPTVAAQSLTDGDSPSLLNRLVAARHSGEWIAELHQRNARGLPIVVESRATLIHDPHGRPHQILFINTDITERKRLQDQFLRAQQRETIGALAGGMAHDLNNALSPILMGIQILRNRTNDDTVRRMLDVMEFNTQRGAGMVRQVLLFSRGQDAPAVPVQIPPLLRELQSILHQSFPPGIEVTVLAPQDLWPVLANPTQLHQILLNLCLNARDAMPSGGRLTLAADNAELAPEELTDLPGLHPGRHLMLLISDTGTGMPPEVQTRLFEPFFTTKPPGLGTGLGLATVASLVKAHRGALRLHSQPGEGTSFEIYLPALPLPSAPLPTPSPTQPTADAPSGRGETILVVDDELSIRSLLREGLVTHGYRVLDAGNAIEAVALARQHHQELRLVITQARLSALAGECLAITLRQQHPRLPLILVSSTLTDGTPPAHVPGPPPAVLTKPFRFEDLLTRIRQLLS